ncbi:MAG TPA: hypothetical protein VFI30_04560 [Nocardioidaceae bacterium]|nr:hypothetical protein [Nocardioidaceae bacterium]
MDTLGFGVLRAAVQQQAVPGQRQELDELGVVYQHQLEQSSVLSELSVASTDDCDDLLDIQCTFGRDVSMSAVEDEVERIWVEEMAHPFWEIHIVRPDEVAGEVRLDGATRFDADGPYVTVRITARRLSVPVQRVGAR